MQIRVFIDSTLLCDPIIQIYPTNIALYSDTYFWSSSNVTFSDPTSSNPIITIINNLSGTYTFSLTASNPECGSVTQEFNVTTNPVQSISQICPLETCTNTPLQICDCIVEFVPEPVSISWSANNPGVDFMPPTDLCPIVTFQIPSTSTNNVVITASGLDICGNPFSIGIPVTISSPQNVTFTLIDPLCESDLPIYILDYVDPSNYIVECVEYPDFIFTPLGKPYLNMISLIDDCGKIHTLEIIVISEEFEFDDINICLGHSIDLIQYYNQQGIYTGDNIINNVFYANTYDEFLIDFVATSFAVVLDNLQ